MLLSPAAPSCCCSGSSLRADEVLSPVMLCFWSRQDDVGDSRMFCMSLAASAQVLECCDSAAHAPVAPGMQEMPILKWVLCGAEADVETQK